MVREHYGPVESLWAACRAYRLIWVFCRGCGRAAKKDPRRIVYQIGDQTFEELGKRMRCDACGARKALVMPSEDPIPRR